MTRNRLFAAVLVLLLWPSMSQAQNREHLQLTADLRILQEHVSRLQLAVNRMDERIEATSQRLDAVNTASVKGFADQQLLINQLASTLTSVRERIDDNSVRVSQLGQEFTAVREGLRLLTDQINTLIGILQPEVAPENAGATTDTTPPTSPDTPPDGTAPPPRQDALGRVILPQSATRIYELSQGDYLSGRYESAIEGFREVIQKYPDSPDAAMAQFQVGQAYNSMKDCRRAIPEYQRFVEQYPDARDRHEGLLMLGWCYNDLGQRANAQQAYQQVIKEHPESTSAIMARQRLEGMGITQ